MRGVQGLKERLTTGRPRVKLLIKPQRPKNCEAERIRMKKREKEGRKEKGKAFKGLAYFFHHGRQDWKRSLVVSLRVKNNRKD